MNIVCKPSSLRAQVGGARAAVPVPQNAATTAAPHRRGKTHELTRWYAARWHFHAV